MGPEAEAPPEPDEADTGAPLKALPPDGPEGAAGADGSVACALAAA